MFVSVQQSIRAAMLLAALGLAACTESEAPPTEAGAPALEPVVAEAAYVGSEQCRGCHEAAYEAWRGSHHRRAMELPGPDTVAAPFAGERFEFDGVTSVFERRGETWIVTTEGADGAAAEFPVRYTFGADPLQQYLLEMPDGRLQALSASFDTRPDREAWFRLYADQHVPPDDVLHWTAPSQNWNAMCADCHSTAVEKRYSPDANRYETTYAEVTVGCEACHGPGSEHVSAVLTGRSPRTFADVTAQAGQIESCAPCHSRRGQLAEGFRPGEPYLDHYLPSLLDEGLYHADGQILDEVYVWGSFLQSRMHEAGVRCTDCHDPHGAQVRLPGDATCTQCHGGPRQAQFAGLGPGPYDDPSHHFHPQESEAARCVSCHMTDRTYMEIDDRRDHSFRLPRPDLAEVTGAPDACTGCHADRDTAWAAAEIAARFGPERRPHYGEVLAAARLGDPAVEQSLGGLADDPEAPAIVRATALGLAAGYGRGWTGNAIRAGLRSEDALVRIGAVRGARRLEPAARWRALAPLLEDELRAVRTEAVRALLDVRGGLDASARARLDAAIGDYLEDLDLVADLAEGQSLIAAAKLAVGDHSGAEAALDRALVLNPSWVPAMVNLADLYRGTARDREGDALLARAVELAPDNADALVARALWLVRQRRSEEALPLLARASSLEPRNPERAYLHAVALSSTGSPLEALAVLDAALERTWDAPVLLQLAAGIARDAGNPARQTAYARRLAERGR